MILELTPCTAQDEDVESFVNIRYDRYFFIYLGLPRKNFYNKTIVHIHRRKKSLVHLSIINSWIKLSIGTELLRRISNEAGYLWSR